MDTMEKDSMEKNLKTLLGFIDGACPTPACNMYDRFYNSSTLDTFQVVGYSDSIMNSGAYIQMLANMGLILEATYTSFSTSNETSWEGIMAKYDTQF